MLVMGCKSVLILASCLEFILAASAAHGVGCSVKQFSCLIFLPYKLMTSKFGCFPCDRPEQEPITSVLEYCQQWENTNKK